MLIKKSTRISSTEITPESVYRSRRDFIGKSAALIAGAGLLGRANAGLQPDDELTPEEIVTQYNNFYEFGTDKGDPVKHAGALTTDPWTVTVSGAANKTGEFAYEEVVKGLVAEERVYRFRCVEAWSMVVPWLGIPLVDILKQFEPTGSAKYVEFKTLYRPEEMPGQNSFFSSIDWPYTEGLRLDEAYHPLTIMAVGLYGKTLPNQNGAPWRLVVPWKYGFKSIKSIVSIRFTEQEPLNTWQQLQPSEYGFYANVNPAVAHPRWSQASERRLPSSLFNQNRRPTLPFNGYADEVASLYAGMDLSKFY
ncbi:MAG TPA: protein-methionine-sulfoxide reductase catalytic subunit MsrP [Gammaproteobacteria bacterium]|nr:MAG: protein-methionine-sulfoxide reductase catalytic subunit MsrP [OM182 bacterium]HAL42625.1 protein-methionine-sulfoxide reductase catalytic subunit MsrP [Gammaproteobacteria bacterium]|tara:strand:- start:990 stop:1910 length:921 start_codon:yes stop_codon:yes gene_type:complete